MSNRRGTFITIEGVEGCGKSTQAVRLGQYLESKGHRVLVTREPGGSPTAEAIRNVLLDPQNNTITPMAELLLYEAARAQHVEERIRPALDSGWVVVCDRFADSTMAYQGFGRGLSCDMIAELNRIATQDTWPGLTVIIDLPADLGLARATQKRPSDRMEREALAFHERVRNGFLKIAETDAQRVRVVNGQGSVEDVAETIENLVEGLLNRA
jgi:dTMP kinase